MRGFSLLTVLLVVVVLTIAASYAYRVSAGEESVAVSRTHQRQALAAAEAGLNHFFGEAPATVQPNTWYVGSDGSDDSHFVYLADTTASNGQTIRSRYRVHSTSTGPVDGSVYVIAAGEVLSGGAVIGRSEVMAIAVATDSGAVGPAGQGQKSLGAWGTNSNLPVRSDISLQDRN